MHICSMAYFGVTFASTSLAGDPYLNFALVIFIELLHVPFEVNKHNKS